MPNPFPDETFEALAEKYADQDFNLMRALLRNVLDVPVFNMPQGDKYLYANAIVTKMYRQACTVKYLLSGTRLWPDQVGERILDTHSLEVIVRSILDSYLVFHHIYVHPKKEDEKQFKFLAWQKAGLLARQKFPIEILNEAGFGSMADEFKKKLKEEREKVIKKLEDEKEYIDEITKEMEENSFFHEVLKCDDSKRIGRYKRCVSSGWRIGENDTPMIKFLCQANLNYFIDRDLWGMASRRAHSDFIHVADIVMHQSMESLHRNFKFTVHTLALILARICFEYAEIFPSANKPMDIHEPSAKVADALVKVSEMKLQSSQSFRQPID